MNFPAFEKIEFPAWPMGRYQTAPVYLEPMAGSGERFAVCAAAVGNEGFEVMPLIRAEVAECLYGKQSANFFGLIDLIASDLREYLSKNQPLSEWSSPMGGAFLGETRPVSADNIRHAISQVARLHASLCHLPALYGVEDDDVVQQRDDTLNAWIKQVQDLTLSRAPLLAQCLNRPVTLARGDNVKLHFASEDRAVSLGLVTPTRLTNRINEAKIKLWNLDHLPKIYSQRELILGVPREDAPDMADSKVRNKVSSSIEALKEEAQLNRIDLSTVYTAQEAAIKLAA